MMAYTLAQAAEDEQIATEPVPLCPHCDRPGASLYAGLSDRLFGAPGRWGHSECPGCGLVWLNPRPRLEDLGKTYRSYFTHRRKGGGRAALRENLKRGLFATVPGYEGVVGGRLWKLAGAALTCLPFWRERAALGTMCLSGSHKGTLLDVGCGDGEFLSIMRDAGWQVAGIEPDAVAAGVAGADHSIPVLAGTLEEAHLPDESMDAVTLSHVIEHAPDPAGLLRECRRILKRQGRIIIITPNLDSRGHRAFREAWVHLDPPRHLYLFSPSTLRRCCEAAGLQVEEQRTSARMAAWVWAASSTIQRKGSFRRQTDLTWKLRIEGACWLVREELSRRARDGQHAGEELVVIAGKKPAEERGPVRPD